MSEIQDQSLRRVFGSIQGTDAVRSDCPGAETIWEAAGGALERAETRAVLDHIASCSVCTESWRLARELQPTDTASGHGKPWRWSPWLGAAAGILLIVGLLPSPDETLRSASADRCESFHIELTDSGFGERVLRWSGIPDEWHPDRSDPRFDVEIFAAVGRTPSLLKEAIFGVRATDRPQVGLPEPLARELEPGTRLRVQVGAFGAGGAAAGGCSAEVVWR